MILFRAQVKLQAASPSMFVRLRGTLAPAPSPSVSCPLHDDRGEPWPGMETAMAAAQQRWHAEGRYPPVAIRVRSFTTHAVDTSARAFEAAVRALLLVALTDRPPPSWCRVYTAPAAGPLPDGLTTLIDAGHVEQAAELLLALQPTQRRQLQRFIQELRLIEDPHLFARLIGVLLPAQGPTALRASVVELRTDLYDRLSQRSPKTWGGSDQYRARALERLSAPIPDLGRALSSALEGAMLSGRREEVWEEVCAAVMEEPPSPQSASNTARSKTKGPRS